MILYIILLIIGFIILIKGADFFVDGASSLSENFKVPKTLIGLTIVAFGTSAPELAVSLSALKGGNSDMVLGNVIGSCILNILLILGIAAVINPLKIKDTTVKKEIPLCLLISSLLVVLFLDIKLNNTFINIITRSDSIVLILFFSVFMYYLVSLALNKKEDKNFNPPFTIGKSIIFIILGLTAIIIGSELVTKNATNIALYIGITQRVISLTIIALGTSLPELITTIISAKKKESDLLIGNIIGSNIFNICIVLGVPTLIFGSVSSVSFSYIDSFMLILSALLLLIFAFTKRTISKFEGYIFLLIFIIYYSFVVI